MNGLDNTYWRTKMKKVVLVLTALLAFGATIAHADEATEQAVIKTIMDGNAYVKKNLKGMDDTIARDRLNSGRAAGCSKKSTRRLHHRNSTQSILMRSTSPSSRWFRGRSPSHSIIQKVR